MGEIAGSQWPPTAPVPSRRHGPPPPTPVLKKLRFALHANTTANDQPGGNRGQLDLHSIAVSWNTVLNLLDIQHRGCRTMKLSRNQRREPHINATKVTPTLRKRVSFCTGRNLADISTYSIMRCIES